MRRCIGNFDLFYVRTDVGYGLFQRLEDQPIGFHPFYLVYCQQIKFLNGMEISKALSNSYYYERIDFGLGSESNKFDIEKIIAKKGVEFRAEDFGLDANNFYFGNAVIAYLGKYPLPDNAEVPKLTRQVDVSYFTGKHSWYIYDEINGDFVRKENGAPLKYNKITPEIASYPLYYATFPRKLVENFNAYYTPESYDDAWIDNELDKYYQEHPAMRPFSKKFDEVKYPLPDKQLRDIVGEEREGYDLFCDELKNAFFHFVNSLEQNKLAVRQLLKELLEKLNAIENETGLIGSLEAEIIYGYIVNVLKSLKKPQLIEFMDEKREW